jgi:hypothetical protein
MPEIMDTRVTPACLQLADRWYNEDGFQERIGWLASRVRTYAIAPSGHLLYPPIICSMDEVAEYRAYVVHARLVGFLEEALAQEALEDCATAEACILSIPPQHSR